MALSKVGELHHLRGDLAAAAGLYARALELRRSLLAATRAQWHREGGDKEVQQQQQQETEAGSEGAEARCSAALDLAASCLKLSGARRGLGSEGDADVRACVLKGWMRLPATTQRGEAGQQGSL